MLPIDGGIGCLSRTGEEQRNEDGDESVSLSTSPVLLTPPMPPWLDNTAQNQFHFLVDCIFTNRIKLVPLQSDSVSYFLDEIERIAQFNYVPSHQDILHCRKATKGVYEFTIRINVSIQNRIWYSN